MGVRADAFEGISTGQTRLAWFPKLARTDEDCVSNVTLQCSMAIAHANVPDTPDAFYGKHLGAQLDVAVKIMSRRVALQICEHIGMARKAVWHALHWSITVASHDAGAVGRETRIGAGVYAACAQSVWVVRLVTPHAADARLALKSAYRRECARLEAALERSEPVP